MRQDWSEGSSVGAPAPCDGTGREPPGWAAGMVEQEAVPQRAWQGPGLDPDRQPGLLDRGDA